VTRTVFLVGPARSGSSLLYKALCLHREVGYVSNWVRRFPAVPALAGLNRVSRALPDARRQVWFGGGDNAYVYGGSRSIGQRTFPMPVEGEPVFRRCGITDTPGGTDGRRPADLDRLRRVFDQVLRAGGGAVLVNKRIANNLRIPLLAQAFPDARFVFLVRDGRAVAHSLSRVDWWEDSTVWWYGGTPRQWAEQGGDPWELCARHWVEELREVEDGLATAVPAERRFDVRYEDFLRNPLDTLRTVGDFAGLRPDPGWMRELERLSFPDRTESWRRHLAPAVADRISFLQQGSLQEYGYWNPDVEMVPRGGQRTEES
jgi:hypothetical protein